MKKYVLVVAITLVTFLFTSLESGAQKNTVSRQENIESPECSQEAEDLYARLDVINEMDKSGMPREEKKALREEVKTIQQRLQEMGNGVYISAGAVIIILLLLLILL
jgi:hypothetical protein